MNRRGFFAALVAPTTAAAADRWRRPPGPQPGTVPQYTPWVVLDIANGVVAGVVHVGDEDPSTTHFHVAVAYENCNGYVVNAGELLEKGGDITTWVIPNVRRFLTANVLSFRLNGEVNQPGGWDG
jgi:hypothetical protein